MSLIIIYTKMSCPYCQLAKNFFSERRIPFQEIRIDLDENKKEEMIKLSQKRTVPQILINGQPIGGYDDLMLLKKSGELDRLLASL